MTTTPDKLAPCPMCQGEATITHNSTTYSGKKIITISCCVSLLDMEEKAIKRWNTRTPSADDIRNRALEEVIKAFENSRGQLEFRLLEIKNKIRALKSKPMHSENTTPVRNDVINFLNGSGKLNGFSYGDRPAAEPNFWWRKYLPKPMQEGS